MSCFIFTVNVFCKFRKLLPVFGWFYYLRIVAKGQDIAEKRSLVRPCEIHYQIPTFIVFEKINSKFIYNTLFYRNIKFNCCLYFTLCMPQLIGNVFRNSSVLTIIISDRKTSFPVVSYALSFHLYRVRSQRFVTPKFSNFKKIRMPAQFNDVGFRHFYNFLLAFLPNDRISPLCGIRS